MKSLPAPCEILLPSELLLMVTSILLILPSIGTHRISRLNILNVPSQKNHATININGKRRRMTPTPENISFIEPSSRNRACIPSKTSPKISEPSKAFISVEILSPHPVSEKFRGLIVKTTVSSVSRYVRSLGRLGSHRD